MFGKKISWDDLERLQNRLDEALSELRDVQAVQNAMRIEWEDVLDRVTRSYKRLEAQQRRERQSAVGAGTPPVSDAADERTDAWSKKVQQVRRQAGAVHAGADTGTG